MERKFVAETLMDKQAYRALNQVVSKKNRIIYLCLGVIMLLESIVVRDNIEMFAVCIILGIFFILFGFFLSRYLAWVAWKNRNPALKEFEFTFDEEKMTVEYGAGGEWFAYDFITRIAETKDYFIILPQKMAGLPISKQAFTEGNLDDFRAFLEEKTGKKFNSK